MKDNEEHKMYNAEIKMHPSGFHAESRYCARCSHCLCYDSLEHFVYIHYAYI